jgi:hypothetical protein
MFTNHTSASGLISKIFKEHTQLYRKKVKNVQGIWVGFLKRRHRNGIARHANRCTTKCFISLDVFPNLEEQFKITPSFLVP